MGGEVVDGLERQGEDFELNTELNWEPVELLENKSDVVDGGGLSNDTGSWRLEQLKFVEGFVKEADKKRVTGV